MNIKEQWIRWCIHFYFCTLLPPCKQQITSCTQSGYITRNVWFTHSCMGYHVNICSQRGYKCKVWLTYTI